MDYVYDWSGKKTTSTQEIAIKKNSLNKPVAKEEEEEKKHQSQQKHGPQVNKTSSSINRTKTNLVSGASKTKTDQLNGKPNFIETLAGQKISGPKISVVKR